MDSVVNDEHSFVVATNGPNSAKLILSDTLLTDVRLALAELLSAEEGVAFSDNRPEDFQVDRNKAAYALWDAIHHFQWGWEMK